MCADVPQFRFHFYPIHYTFSTTDTKVRMLDETYSSSALPCASCQHQTTWSGTARQSLVASELAIQFILLLWASARICLSATQNLSQKSKGIHRCFKSTTLITAVVCTIMSRSVLVSHNESFCQSKRTVAFVSSYFITKVVLGGRRLPFKSRPVTTPTIHFGFV